MTYRQYQTLLELATPKWIVQPARATCSLSLYAKMARGTNYTHQFANIAAPTKQKD